MAAKELNVRLIEHTPDPEHVAALAAKTCYSASSLDDLNEKISKSDQSKFLRMLLDVKHFTAVEHVSFTFAVEGVSRSLLAQITRHRIASFSVQSQRYVSQIKTGGEVFDYIIPPAIKALGDEAIEKFDGQMRVMQDWYNQWQEALAKNGKNGEKTNEDARFVLPNAAETRFIMTMNARELLHFFSLRCCGRAQWEIRELAWRMLALVTEIAPILFESAGPSCLTGKCPEGKRACGMQAEMKIRKDELKNG